MSTQNEMRTIIVEAPSGERFETEVPCDTKISKLAVDFFEAQGWPTEQRGQRQRAVVELVNPHNPDETKRLNGDGSVCEEGVENGDTLRIFSESIAGATVAPRARQGALIDDHNGMRALCDRDPQISFSANREFAPDEYTVVFTYPSFVEPPAGAEPPLLGDRHEVRIILGAGYPRQAPFVRWLTPIFHPNIRAADGAVCLGVLGRRFLPGMGLARLVRMLAEMVQWRNYDAANAFNRAAAEWAADMANWPKIETLVGGYPLKAHQGVAELLRIVEKAGQQSITFRPLAPGG
jgi:hypothetical protein